MQVHGAGTDGAAAGQGHVRLAKTRQQGSEHQDGGAHHLHQLIGCGKTGNGGRVDLDGHALVHGDAHPHAPQQADGSGHILQMRHVAQMHAAVAEQGGRQDRQGGILRARYTHLAVERRTAGNYEFIHSVLWV